jgi:hypothetical protein
MPYGLGHCPIGRCLRKRRGCLQNCWWTPALDICQAEANMGKNIKNTGTKDNFFPIN